MRIDFVTPLCILQSLLLSIFGRCHFIHLGLARVFSACALCQRPAAGRGGDFPSYSLSSPGHRLAVSPPTHPSNWADPKTTSLSIKSEAASIQASTMAELRRVPGVHVYGGTAPLAAGVEKIPKQRNIIFNVDLEESDLKDLPSFKVPFDPERPLPFSSFDEICAALKPEDDKTQCIFNAKDVHAATTGRESSTNGKSEKRIETNQYITYFYFCPSWFKVFEEVLPKYSLKFLTDITHA